MWTEESQSFKEHRPYIARFDGIIVMLFFSRRDFIHFALLIPFLSIIIGDKRIGRTRKTASIWIFGGRGLDQARHNPVYGQYGLTVRLFEVFGNGKDIGLIVDGTQHDIEKYVNEALWTGTGTSDYAILPNVIYSKPLEQRQLPFAFVTINSAGNSSEDIARELLKKQSVNMIGFGKADNYPLGVEFANISSEQLLKLLEEIVGPNWFNSQIMLVQRKIS